MVEIESEWTAGAHESKIFGGPVESSSAQVNVQKTDANLGSRPGPVIRENDGAGSLDFTPSRAQHAVRDTLCTRIAKHRSQSMDVLSQAARSALMSRIRSKDTRPELLVRSCLHRLGFRFRLHVATLPGRPDIVLPRYRKIILVHGCFWHAHNCALASRSKTNPTYWLPKLQRNKARDLSVVRRLRRAGWSVLLIWECQVRRGDIVNILRHFMR